ncbi:hypothetical protein P170DRAFT_244530 [Aspergillus steynii IBT 23096]|uniref:Uncharacterized protein n=1 Tax=Aspergillus steynii IBT 23096 TaxID=1392250 RepID=A0A2I2FY18_9EURO|nr:uncharacterized protein P170DRAFT_244530 [Aspergillus steynii IBT 23096]PLB45476.1 hypothetical protein P170DRAFT_244530 [Aspergillus steynii IBT 23096]
MYANVMFHKLRWIERTPLFDLRSSHLLTSPHFFILIFYFPIFLLLGGDISGSFFPASMYRRLEGVSKGIARFYTEIIDPLLYIKFSDKQSWAKSIIGLFSSIDDLISQDPFCRLVHTWDENRPIRWLAAWATRHAVMYAQLRREVSESQQDR